METIAHDGSGGGQSRRWSQAIAVVGCGGEVMGNRQEAVDESGKSEYQRRPAIETSPAKRVSSINLFGGYAKDPLFLDIRRVYPDA